MPNAIFQSSCKLEKGSKKVEQVERETETGRDRKKQGDKERERRGVRQRQEKREKVTISSKYISHSFKLIFYCVIHILAQLAT